MKNKQIKRILNVCLLAAGLAWTGTSQAAQLMNFPFNEGSGNTVTDTANGYVGSFGTFQNPAVDYVDFNSSSPSGQPSDKSLAIFGNGFLVADDSTNQVLNITNGPITMEAWVYLPPVSSNIMGIASYGFSYKLGMRGGFEVFTLYGQKDITNINGGFVFDGQWNHLAAAWDPGVGVHFYLNGVHNFVEYTNNPAARPVQHNFLTLGAENFGNSFNGSIDRVRIHHALLDETQLDSDAANPKAPLASTVVSYNFNEAAFPCTNELAPSLPTRDSASFVPTLGSPEWSADSPSGLNNDYSLSFELDQMFRDVVTVDYSSNPIDLASNNTNYTLQAWIKMPTRGLEERRVIYTTSGTAPRIALSINANRTLHTTIFGVADFTTSVSVPNDNRWHHVAAVMSNYTTLSFYLDGALRQTVNRTQTGTASSGGASELRIGKEGETRYFEGLLDRVIINNDALDAAALDFPALPGLATFPTFASQPASLVLAAGSDASFTASPSSSTAATYQWLYRTDLAGQGTPIAGETSTTLTVTNISAEDLGYYSLLVSNEAGAVESYAARLSFPVDLSPKVFDFESLTYTSGSINDQDGWSIAENSDSARVATAAEIVDFLGSIANSTNDPVHAGSQALIFSGPGVAANAYRYFTGLETETDVTMDAWVRALEGSPNGNVFVPLEDSAGNRAAAFRIGPSYSIDYGLVSGAWVPSGKTATPGTWHHIKLHLNYSTKTYDFFVDDEQINSSPIPFYSNKSTQANRVHLFKGANQIGMIMDDLNVSAPAAAPQLGIRQSGSDLVLFWPASVTDYVLEATPTLTSPTWSPVSYSTVGNENQATISPGAGNQFYRLRK